MQCYANGTHQIRPKLTVRSPLCLYDITLHSITTSSKRSVPWSCFCTHIAQTSCVLHAPPITTSFISCWLLIFLQMKQLLSMQYFPAPFRTKRRGQVVSFFGKSLVQTLVTRPAIPRLSYFFSGSPSKFRGSNLS
jgi:hypothetical protein